jgi:hypothetical protein
MMFWLVSKFEISYRIIVTGYGVAERKPDYGD